MSGCGGQAIGEEQHTCCVCRDAPTQRAARAAIENQTRLRQLALDSASDGVLLIEHEDISVVEANSAFAEMLGYEKREDLIGLHPWDWDINAREPLVRAAVAASREGASEPLKEYETVFRRRDGSLFDAEVHLSFFVLEGCEYTYAVLRDITERKAAAKALRESETKFRTLSETTRRMIVVLTPQGLAIAANPVAHAFAGYTAETAPLLYFWEGAWWLDEADRARVQEGVAEAADGEYVQFEIRMRGADGSIRHVDLSIAPITDDKGKVTELMAEASDITALKETQAELARHSQVMSAILRQAPGGVLLVSENTHRMAEFNDHACAMHGYSREEFAQLTISDIKASATPDILEARRQQTISEGHISFEDKHRCKDGTILDVRVSLSRVLLDDEYFTVALWVDISDLKRSEEALRTKEVEVRTLVEHTPDGMVRYDRDLRRIFINSAMTRFLGHPVGKLLGTKLDQIPALVDPDAYKSQLQETFRSGTPKDFEAELWEQEGRPKFAHIRFAPEFYADGTVATVLAIIQDITEIVEQRHKVNQLAYSDALTGLPNRTRFNERFAEVVADATEHDQQVLLLLLDIDRFKDVNDSLGHAAGDEFLRQVAERLSRIAGPHDLLARLGGDEFALLQTDPVAIQNANETAEHILQAFQVPFQVGCQEIFASTSIGVAAYPDHGVTTEDLFARADVAMYEAKRKGRGGVQFYAQELTDEAARRLALGTALRMAAAHEELELFYQPKFRLSDNTLIGAEALLRWRHPEFGLLAPNAFIGLAEETGVIVDIGRWVLEVASRAAVAWNAGRTEQWLKLAVNLSSRQFTQNDIVADVRAALSRTGCRADWLECEITESLILKDEECVHQALAGISGMGISIAIDDFGTGQSALSYLDRFHVDVLKIDRSFVDGMETDQRKAELTKAFISIAKALDMDTVAEGIENRKQVALLQQFGCEIGQGYHLGKPVPEALFRRLYLDGGDNALPARRLVQAR